MKLLQLIAAARSSAGRPGSFFVLVMRFIVVVTYIYTYIHTYIYTDMHVCIYIYIYIHVYIYIYIHIYIFIYVGYIHIPWVSDSRMPGLLPDALTCPCALLRPAHDSNYQGAY